MANKDYLARLRASIMENNYCATWNEWRKAERDKYKIVIDLSGADLSKADLRDASLSNTNLRGADLSKTNLTKASFIDSDLSLRFNQRLAIGDSEEDRK